MWEREREMRIAWVGPCEGGEKKQVKSARLVFIIIIIIFLIFVCVLWLVLVCRRDEMTFGGDKIKLHYIERDWSCLFSLMTCLRVFVSFFSNQDRVIPAHCATGISLKKTLIKTCWKGKNAKKVKMHRWKSHIPC